MARSLLATAAAAAVLACAGASWAMPMRAVRAKRQHTEPAPTRVDLTRQSKHDPMRLGTGTDIPRIDLHQRRARQRRVPRIDATTRNALLLRSFQRPGRRGRFVNDRFHGRQISVYLPPGYKPDGQRKHKVVYMLDGQDLFADGSRQDPRKWNAAFAMDEQIRSQTIEPTIIVSIWHGGIDRIDEYAPFVGFADPGDARNYGGEKAEDHTRFIVERLMPWVESTFEVRLGRENTAVIGSSMGGIKALALGLEFPDRFGSVGALSPASWWGSKDADGRLTNDGLVDRIVRADRLQDFARPGHEAAPPRIYLSHGGDRTGTREYRGDSGQFTHDLARNLAGRQRGQGLRYWYTHRPGYQHTQKQWSDSLYEALWYTLSDQVPEYSFQD